MRALKRGFKWNGLFIANMNMLTTSLLLKAENVAVHFLRYNCAFNFNYRYKTNVNILLSCKRIEICAHRFKCSTNVRRSTRTLFKLLTLIMAYTIQNAYTHCSDCKHCLLRGIYACACA